MTFCDGGIVLIYIVTIFKLIQYSNYSLYREIQLCLISAFVSYSKITSQPS